MTGSYIGVFGNNVLKVKKENENIIFQGMLEEPIEQVVTEYFDFNRDYSKIQKTLSKIDKNMQVSIAYGKGIRLLNQDLWETIISFIISANNNIPRIKGIIERLSKQYGKEITWNGKTYYTFPTAQELSKASVEDLRKLGLGFRDKRVYETTKLIQTGKVNLQNLLSKTNTQEIRNILLTLPGVGPKVADCIMLFSTLKRLDVFPVDVWVRRVMNELYFHYPKEESLRNQEIEKLVQAKFGNVAGLAQQYLFYWKRNSKESGFEDAS